MLQGQPKALRRVVDRCEGVPERPARDIGLGGQRPTSAVTSGRTGRYVIDTLTDADVVELPATSVATAVSLCVPLETFLVFQLNEYGLELSVPS